MEGAKICIRVVADSVNAESQFAGFARATARSNHRSNGGVAFVFVEILRRKLDFESALSQKFSQVRNRIPKAQIAKAKT